MRGGRVYSSATAREQRAWWRSPDPRHTWLGGLRARAPLPVASVAKGTGGKEDSRSKTRPKLCAPAHLAATHRGSGEHTLGERGLQAVPLRVEVPSVGLSRLALKPGPACILLGGSCSGGLGIIQKQVPPCRPAEGLPEGLGVGWAQEAVLCPRGLPTCPSAHRKDLLSPSVPSCPSTRPSPPSLGLCEELS